MANAGDIKVTLSVDGQKFATGLKKADNAAKKFAKGSKKAEKEAVSLGKAIGTVAKKALLFVAAFRVAKNVITAFATNVTTMQKLAKETKIWSETLGVGTGKLQEFTIASEQLGFQGEKVNDVLKDVSEKIGEFVSSGGGEAKDIFKRLNIGIEAFKNLDPVEVMQKLQRAMQELEGTTGELTKGEKIAVFEALANDASKFLPLLANNSEKLKEFMALAGKSGRVMSDDDLKKMKKLNKATDEITNAWKGLKTQAIISLVDPIVLAIKKTEELIKLAREYVGIGQFQATRLLDATMQGYDPNAKPPVNLDNLPRSNQGDPALTWAELKTKLIRQPNKQELRLAGNMNKVADYLQSLVKQGIDALQVNQNFGTGLGDLGNAVAQAVINNSNFGDGKDDIGSKGGPQMIDGVLTWIKPIGENFGKSAELFKSSIEAWKASIKTVQDIFNSQKTALTEEIITGPTSQIRDNDIERLTHILAQDIKTARNEGDLSKTMELDFQSRGEAIKQMIESLTARLGTKNASTGETIRTDAGLLGALKTVMQFGKAKPQAPVKIEVSLEKGLMAKITGVGGNFDGKVMTHEDLAKEAGKQ